MGHERMEELRGKIATDSFEMHYFAVPKFFSSEYQQLALVRWEQLFGLIVSKWLPIKNLLEKHRFFFCLFERRRKDKTASYERVKRKRMYPSNCRDSRSKEMRSRRKRWPKEEKNTKWQLSSALSEKWTKFHFEKKEMGNVWNARKVRWDGKESGKMKIYIHFTTRRERNTIKWNETIKERQKNTEGKKQGSRRLERERESLVKSRSVSLESGPAMRTRTTCDPDDSFRARNSSSVCRKKRGERKKEEWGGGWRILWSLLLSL